MSENASNYSEQVVKNLKNLIDTNSIIGNPITTPDGTMIIPVSKVTFGYASGGSDITKNDVKDAFGGGNGGGVTIHPLGFLVVKDGDVKMINISESKTTSDRIVSMVPEVIDKISNVVNKNKSPDITESPKESVSETGADSSIH